MSGKNKNLRPGQSLNDLRKTEKSFFDQWVEKEKARKEKNAQAATKRKETAARNQGMKSLEISDPAHYELQQKLQATTDPGARKQIIQQMRSRIEPGRPQPAAPGGNTPKPSAKAKAALNAVMRRPAHDQTSNQKLREAMQIQGVKKSEAKSDDSEVASIAVRRGQHLLMGRRRDVGRWTLPGGHLNTGEKPVDGAVRELFEEAGIRVHPGELKHVATEDLTTFSGKKKRIHAYVYEHKGELAHGRHDPDQEVEKWEWIDCGKGLPDHVRSNLHSPKNLLLQRLGLLGEPMEKSKLPKFDARKVPAEHRRAATNWVLHDRGATRETLPRLEGPARERALHKLGAATKTRFNPTTREREFLLHRGVSKEEAQSALQGQHVRHDKMTSWTPDGATAAAFAKDYGESMGRGRKRQTHKLSAWISESRIHHIPSQMGYVKRTGAMASMPNRDEREVIVDSHRSQLAHPDDTKTAFDYKQTLDSRISAKGGFGRPSHAYEHMRPLKNWMKKTETLQKSPLIEEQDDRFARGVLENNPPAGMRLASKTKLGNDLWHHHYVEEHEAGGFMHHHYLTSDDSAPEYDKNLIGHMHGAADEKTGHLHVYESAVEPHLQRRGHGTAMYRQAAKIHGGLISGVENLSSAASSIYHKLSRDPEFKGKLAPEVSHDDIEDDAVSEREVGRAEKPHKLKYVRPGKMKKSEDLKKMPVEDNDINVTHKNPTHFNKLPDGIHDDGREWLVHKQGGKIIAAIRFSDHNAKHNAGQVFGDSAPTDDTSRIDHVWVHPNHRNQGVARNLLLHAIKTHGAVESNLSVNSGGQALWESLKKEKGIRVKMNNNDKDYGHIGWLNKSLRPGMSYNGLRKAEDEFDGRKTNEKEVRAHIDRVCPHRDTPHRNARRHAVIENQTWTKTKIPLSEIPAHHYPAHSKRDVARYEKMIRSGSKPPAVVLTSMGRREDGTYSIMDVQDGRHRIAAAHRAGMTHIDAYVGAHKIGGK
jgi:8-oxo-dGTP pyrophosphatase MutT (NUDIX family)/ribosomal protein S18 acetylase RimI-like enzyme